MLPEQPAHDAFLMGERLSAGVLVAEAAAGEELRRANVQHDELVDGLIRQALLFIKRMERVIGFNKGGRAVVAILSADGEINRGCPPERARSNHHLTGSWSQDTR